MLSGKEKKVQFSVIVPVYNTEDFLCSCLDSIIGQTIGDFELVIIDDGSTDKSGEICEDYKSKHDNIIVLHTENRGLSQARNLGVKVASGSYVVFVDGDDYIEEQTLQIFKEKLEQVDNADVLITKLKEVNSLNKKVKYMDQNITYESIESITKENLISWYFSNTEGLWPSVKYIVRHSLIDNKSIEFPKGFLHEDVEWTTLLFLYGENFAGLDFYWYNHTIGRDGSITSTPNPKRTCDVITLVSRNYNNISNSQLKESIKKVMLRRLVNSIFSSLRGYRHFDRESKRAIISLMGKNRAVFKYAVHFRHVIFVAVSRVLGIRVALFLMTIVHRD